MSASATPLSPGLSNKLDPSLKPNSHPYAIKTTHTGILSRSNSSGPNTHSRYFYTPPQTPSRSPTKPTPEYRSHRHSASLSNEMPLPLPSPLASPAHSQRSPSEDDILLRRQRADTLPTYLANNDTVSVEPEEDLPPNPKAWTPSQLSVYLTAALHVRSGARLPERVALDIATWVRREAVTGRVFLRWTDEDLKALGVNTLWRGALLASARNLRQNMLRGRIWGSPTTPEPEQEEEQENDAVFGSSPDFPLADANADVDATRPPRWSTNSNGHVRGMVDKWERESAGSRSSSRSSSHRRRDEPSLDVVPPLPFPNKGSTPAEEPSIEDLLADADPPPMDGSWGARAWEDLDIGVTVRRLDAAAHETVVPRRNGSGSGSSGGSKGDEGGGSQRARRAVVDIFADDVDNSRVVAEVQVDARSPDDVRAEAELEAKERALEDEVRRTRTLLEEFRRRLEMVEARVGALETEWHAKEERTSAAQHNDKAVEPALPLSLSEVVAPPTPSETTSSSLSASSDADDTDSERGVVSPGVGLGGPPEAVSDLPSYVFLVGLGVCTVVLQVVLKRVAGRSLKS